MPVVLALLYVLCHGLVLALWPGPAGVGSFVFLTGAPLLAAAACLWRAPPRPPAPGGAPPALRAGWAPSCRRGRRSRTTATPSGR
ncbi:hypothetical protein DI494_20270 [Stenotrophomonas maltophilia]|nr:hypothetical protein DI494_20270 [Stenotrophomonas maltophilia]